jgi:nucleotide-binding universal stress UspA family protein
MDEVLHIRNRIMLLTPETFAEPKSWLMALDGGPSSGRAVEYLIQNPLMRSVPGTAAIVGPDHQHRIHFRDALKHLQSSGYRITPHELQGNADDVLLAIMQVAPVDLLVMGAYGQGKFRSLFERSTTSRLLGAFRGPVLVART